MMSQTTQTVSTQALSLNLKQLLLAARICAPGSRDRQRVLTQMIRLINQSGKLWQENTPYYEDALQQTWLYFCLSVCDLNVAQLYNSEGFSIIGWLDAYLRNQLQNFRSQEQYDNENFR